MDNQGYKIYQIEKIYNFISGLKTLVYLVYPS